MKLKPYKSTIFRRLPYHPGGDFAVVEFKAYHDIAAARKLAGILATTPADDYDWRYSPIMLYYDVELEFTTPAPK